MKNRLHITLLVVAATMSFGVYAADEPNTAPSTATAASDQISSIDDEKRISYGRKQGFRRVVKDGEEMFCRREVVTGSRLKSNVTCLTQAQLDVQMQGARDFIDRVRNAPVEEQGADSGGGRSMGPMSQ